MAAKTTAKAAPAAKAKAAPAAAYQDYIRQALGGLSAAGAKSSGYLNQLAMAQGEQKRDAAMAGGLTTYGGPTPANPYADKLIQAELALARDKAGVLGQGAGYASQLEGLRYKTDAQKALQEAQFAHQTERQREAQDWKSGESLEERIARGGLQSNLFGHQAGMQQAGFGQQTSEAALDRDALAGRVAGERISNLEMLGLKNPSLLRQSPYTSLFEKYGGKRTGTGTGPYSKFGTGPGGYKPPTTPGTAPTARRRQGWR